MRRPPVKRVGLPVLLLAVLPGLAPAPRAADAPRLDLRDPRHVRALHLDVLGRTPDQDELQLASGAPPERVLAVLLGSREAWEHWYEEELAALLLFDDARPPDPADPEQGVPARLQRGELHVLSALSLLVGGQAFHRANPGPDTFVSVVFEHLLGLRVQDDRALLEAGKRMYDGRRASLWGSEGGSQADVVAIACAQPAFAERLLARAYERMVGRAPPRAELAAWAGRLRARPACFPELAKEWLLSPAYAARLAGLRSKSDRQFVRGLYVDLLGAPPGEPVLRRHRAALAAVGDPGPLRAVVARLLLDAEGAGLPPYGPDETADLVRDAYLRFLGREPAPDELEALVLLHDQGGGRPEDVVAALITHWEYQYY